MKIGLISLGCPKNLVDSEVMLGLAQQAGHELTRDAQAAEILVVNTCAFIDSAKQESIDAILEMAQHKKDGACRRLIVTGCLAERYREDLKKQIAAEKDTARNNIAESLGREKAPGSPARYVCINAIGHARMDADLEAVIRPGLEGLVCPKVDTPDEVRKIDAILNDREPKISWRRRA